MIKYKITISSFLLTTGLLSGCETFQPAPEQKPSIAAEAIKEIEEQQKQINYSEISNQEILNSLLPETISEPELEEDRFDVSVKNIDARSFLLGLVDSTHYNMVVSPDVNEKISLQLNNVTVSEVLHALEKIYPLMIEQKNNLFFVSSAETMTVVYPVDYLNLSRQGTSRTSIAGQTVSSGKNNNNQSGGQSNNQSDSGSSVTLLNSSEIKTESNANFWHELQQSLNLIIKNEEKANVVVSPHAGIVVVRALPKTQRLIKEYLGITQESLDRQVILEAKIIEVNLADGFQSGIDWSRMNTVNDGANLKYSQSGQLLKTQASDFPLNGMFSFLYQATSFQAAIDLLKTQGDVQILSSPRVSTVNNQKAIIKVGSDEFFVTDVSTTTVTGTSTATTPDVTLTPFFSGISLDVTPQINKAGEIVLHIHPVVSEVDDQKKTLTLGQDQFTLPLALTNIRESDSIVRTSDQQVIVIGGLMQNRVQTDVNSTPLLGDIPVLGELFKQTRESIVKSELVILLKANLVDKRFNQKEINRIKKRFER
ncbi:pilus (MSHA type) biogenesis protein MshL [Aliikangiella sp. IMCC44359]|uniref:pilus (MSHA type) biogenesis protein MshL n=1 Tax=Aliikangiella sp. IMCC44359 TaxID=3459125 RepID=UPI00403AAFEF